MPMWLFQVLVVVALLVIASGVFAVRDAIREATLILRSRLEELCEPERVRERALEEVDAEFLARQDK